MQAPAFTLPDQDGKPVDSSSFGGSRLIIFFYPRASTPGCTQEACDFRDEHARLRSAGFQLVGISPDQPSANAAFRDAHGLDFPLLSDATHKVAEAYGAWGTKMNYGREYEGLIRSTFVIDRAGQVECEYRNVRASGHVARVLRDLDL